MTLRDKPCYAVIGDSHTQNFHQEGLNFYERLIIALAGNPEMFLIDGKSIESGDAAKIIIESANAIMKELEK